MMHHWKKVIDEDEAQGFSSYSIKQKKKAGINLIKSRCLSGGVLAYLRDFMSFYHSSEE